MAHFTGQRYLYIYGLYKQKERERGGGIRSDGNQTITITFDDATVWSRSAMQNTRIHIKHFLFTLATIKTVFSLSLQHRFATRIIYSTFGLPSIRSSRYNSFSVYSNINNTYLSSLPFPLRKHNASFPFVLFTKYLPTTSHVTGRMRAT